MSRRFYSLLTAVLAVALFGVLAPNDSRAEVTLTIGDKAPSLDIEHYIHEPKGDFGKVTDFEKGKIYVVEFWATWCGPCIQSMPHLVELQNQYRGEGVQIVSITDEDLDTVKELLDENYPGKEQTYREITSAYTLTADPDGSVSDAYMRAAGQNGIPASFLVGKTGLVEWIGHPMELDEPLAQVVAGTWDREAFKEQMKLQEKLLAAMQKVNQLAGSGKFEDAIKVIDKIMVEIKGDDPRSEMIREQLATFRFNLRLDSGDRSDEVIAFFRKQIAQAKDDPRQIMQFGYGLMDSMQQGTDPGPLADETIAAISEAVENADDEMKPIMYNLLAQMNASMSKFDEAIAAQTKAVETSSDKQKERMQQMLDQLKEMAETGGEEAADKEPADEK